MDGATIHIAVHSLLECSICLQIFQDARSLPCGHTFCLQCIQKTNNQLCSLCKKEWSLSANGYQGPQKNFIVESIISSLPCVSQCALAESSSHGPVESFCVDCWDPLCEKCALGHNQFSRMTKTHVIKKLIDIDQSDVVQHNQKRALLCSQHKGEIIKFFCTNCKQFICSTCHVLSSHNGHRCTSVEEEDDI